jgi:hypothetical protein
MMAPLNKALQPTFREHAAELGCWAAKQRSMRSAGSAALMRMAGLQRSIREWAIRQGWGGRPVRVEQAQGILVAALGVLEKYYGYGGTS